MEKPLSKFEEQLKTVKETQKEVKTTPHIAMEHFNVSRRGVHVSTAIHKLLEKYDVISEPEIGTCWVYSSVILRPKPKVKMGLSNSGSAKDYDPTPRLSMLEAANIVQKHSEGKGIGLISVTPNTKLTEATTLMLIHDFSQLPILSGREVKGMLSWKSIGRALALGIKCETVNDCKEEAVIMNYDEPLFKAVDTILEKEVVLVKTRDNSIGGIVTATDIGVQFIGLAEPFLIIEQIENHLRKLLDGKFTNEELKKHVNPGDIDREIKSLADLNFGEYINILENPTCFDKLKLQIDRSTTTKQLHEVRRIRNDVMHFDPDGVSPDDLEL